MNVNKLIAELQVLAKDHGDLEVVTLDADTQWLMKMGTLPFFIERDCDKRRFIVLDGGDYTRDAYYD